jgi:predicted enzyme related to lactoylglutathione lyase
MKKATLLILALATAFSFGFAFKSYLGKPSDDQATIKRVTGIGGIFFKCKDPNQMREWYKTHLGLNTNAYGTVFEWRQGADSTKKGFTQWSPFAEKTKYFQPSEKDFMINYRVENLEALVAELKKEGVIVTDSIETVDYGKFVHIMDIEGNKLELWEPNDLEYEKLGKQLGSETTK